MGKALAPLRDEGVMIAASGAEALRGPPPVLVDLSKQVRLIQNLLHPGMSYHNVQGFSRGGGKPASQASQVRLLREAVHT